MTEIWQKVEQAPLLPLGPSHRYSIIAQELALPLPGEHLRLCPLLHNRYTKTKNGPNERTDQSFRKNKLSEEEIANVSDAEFKTWVIRILTELVDYGRKIEEKVKTMKSEIKKNIQGTNSRGKESGTQINGLDQKEKINNQPKQNEEARIQKMRRGLGTSGTTLNVPTFKS